jgi:iron-sulfur cluster repair protein YtfE (RIC family)
MKELSRLRDEHARLMVTAGKLSAMIAQHAPPPAQELYSVRMKLASELTRHLKTEDWILYPRLLLSSDRHVAETSRAFSQEMGGLAKEFREYADRWVAYAIDSDWKGFQRETTEILTVLARRMKREEQELYPLLEAPSQASAAAA